MYACHYCGNCFDEDELVGIEQYDGEGVMGGWHVVEGACPYCGSTDDWGEAEECSVCGEYCHKEDDMIEVDDFWYCRECAKHVHDEYEKAWMKMRA